MKSVLLAFAFLTRLRLPRLENDDEGLRRAVVHFPLVGLVLGALLALCASSLAELGRPLVAGVALVAALALATGALHLDGVADWFDAVGGGYGDRERMLSIMRDPHVGAHAVVALCLVLVAKVALFAGLVEGHDSVPWVAMPLTARAVVVPVLSWLPAARSEGLAWSLRPRRPLFATSVAIAWLVLPSVALESIALAVSCTCALCVGLGVGLWAHARLGGITGDLCGVVIELSEIAFAATWLAFGEPS